MLPQQLYIDAVSHNALRHNTPVYKDGNGSWGSMQMSMCKLNWHTILQNYTLRCCTMYM